LSTPPSSILIVKLSAIGDVIHSLPALDTLRAMAPDARIGWIVEELSAPLLENHPHLSKLYVVPRKRWRRNKLRSFFSEMIPFFREVRRDGWEVAIDLQGLSKSGLAAWASGASTRIGFAGAQSREVNRLFINRPVAPRPEDVHVVQKYRRILEGLGLPGPEGNAGEGRIGVLPAEAEAMRAKLASVGWTGEPLLAINPGAGWITKRWPPAFHGRLAARVREATGLLPIVLWGPGEEAWRDEIIASAGQPALAAPPTRIRELAVLISLCRLMVGGDTGPTHMAGLCGVPVISLFGASDGVRNCPWPPDRGVVVQRDELDCIRCWKTICPREGDAHLACLRGLTPETVFAKVEPWLNTQSFR
jgi:lipopolysaccharide heptosyltransferase I